GREVEALVEVALARRAVTDEAERDAVAASTGQAVPSTSSVDGLGRERRALGGGARRDRVVAAVPRAAQQRQHLDRVQAAADQRHRVAVGREEPVVLLESEDRGDLAGVLAARGGIDRQTALLGQRRG